MYLSAVLLDEVLVRCAFIVGLNLIAVVVRCRHTGTDTGVTGNRAGNLSVILISG